MTLSIDTLDEQIKFVKPLPLMVIKVQELIQREKINIVEIAQCISQDPAISARILRVANSPFYGFSGEVGSIKEACVVLGVPTTRNIVLTAGIFEHFNSHQLNYINLETLWKHSMGVGISAKVLSKLVKLDEEIAFTAGLLHDIGKVILDVYFPNEYERVIQYRDLNNCLLREAEQAILGFDHGLVGAKVARIWKLPETIACVIENHHAIDNKAESTALTDLVHVADIVSRGLNIGNGGDACIPSFSSGVLQRLDLSLEKIAAGFPQIQAFSDKSSQVYN